MEIREVDPFDIFIPPSRARSSFRAEERNQLFESMKTVGLKTPIQAYEFNEPYQYGESTYLYVLADGQRRVEGAIELKWKTITTEVIGKGRPEEVIAKALLHSLITSIKGKPDIITMSACINELKDLGVTFRELGRALGRHEDEVGRMANLINLTESVADAVRGGSLEWTKGFEISRIKNSSVQDKVYSDYLRTRPTREKLAQYVSKIVEKAKTMSWESAYEEVKRKELRFLGEISKCDACEREYPKSELILRRVCKPCNENIFLSAEEKKALVKT